MPTFERPCQATKVSRPVSPSPLAGEGLGRGPNQYALLSFTTSKAVRMMIDRSSRSDQLRR
ncbi:MAG: hypothetical protein QG667_2305 [Pseudomonadota bacterium]|nr:hypothetical protein [Pseudomonadota bacterium]